jgi:predicted nucleotidyltransferase
MAIDLSEGHRKLLRAILSEHLRGVSGLRVYVYGSRVRGNGHKFSDVDLAFEADHPVAGALLNALREAFDGSALPYAVDLTDLHHVTPTFRANVDRCRELLFEV